MAKRKKGVRKGREAQASWSPPEKHAGRYGSHRTESMEERREARVARQVAARHPLPPQPCPCGRTGDHYCKENER